MFRFYRISVTVDSFRSVLVLPHVRPVATSSLLARLPKGMVPLATVLLLHQSTGSYAIAGLATALIAVGDAATAPVEGRLVDRYGPARTLLPLAVLHMAAVAALLVFATRDRFVVGMVTSACVVGIGVPPVSGCIKAVWPRLVDARRLPTAYAIESLLQQVTFLSGPLLVALMAAIAGPAVALGCAAAMVGTGTAWFVSVASSVSPRSRRRHGATPGAVRVGAVRVLVCGTCAQSVVFGALPVGIAALTAANHTPGLAGVVLAMQTFGGVLGTFLPARPASSRRFVRLLTQYAVSLAPVAVLALRPSTPALLATGLILIAAGLSLTPIAAAGYLLMQQATESAHRTEAFAWLSTGQAVGTAIGAFLAGTVVDHAGPALALAIMPTAAGLAALGTRYGLRSQHVGQEGRGKRARRSSTGTDTDTDTEISQSG